MLYYTHRPVFTGTELQQLQNNAEHDRDNKQGTHTPYKLNDTDWTEENIPSALKHLEMEKRLKGHEIFKNAKTRRWQDDAELYKLAGIILLIQPLQTLVEF